MSVAANITARQEAEALLSLAGEQSQRFWEIVADYAASKLPPKPVPVDRYPPMTEQEAMHFEEESMPYGKHQGGLVGMIDVDYLLFLTEGDEFSKRLKRYVKSKRFQDRQEE